MTARNSASNTRGSLGPGTVSHPIRMCACRPILGFQLRLDTIFVDNIPLELGLICTSLGTAHLRDEGGVERMVWFVFYFSVVRAVPGKICLSLEPTFIQS